MEAVLELLTVIFFAILPTKISLFLLLKKEQRVIENVSISLLMAVIYQLGSIFLILYIGLHQKTHFSSVGLDFTNPDKIINVFFAIGVFLGVYALAARFITGKKQEIDRTSYHAMLADAAKTPFQKTLFSLNFVFAAISEELVYRGYFILLWVQRTGIIIPWAILSACLFIVGHLHYKKRDFIFVIFFTIAVTAVVIAADNIVGAIAYHGLVNFIVSMKLLKLLTSKKEKATENVSAIYRPQFKKSIPISNLAVFALIIGVIGIPTFPISFAIPSIVSLIMAIIALRRINRSNSQLSGKALAIAAIIMSSLVICIFLIIVSLFLILFHFSQ